MLQLVLCVDNICSIQIQKSPNPAGLHTSSLQPSSMQAMPSFLDIISVCVQCIQICQTFLTKCGQRLPYFVGKCGQGNIIFACRRLPSCSMPPPLQLRLAPQLWRPGDLCQVTIDVRFANLLVVFLLNSHPCYYLAPWLHLPLHAVADHHQETFLLPSLVGIIW